VSLPAEVTNKANGSTLIGNQLGKLLSGGKNGTSAKNGVTIYELPKIGNGGVMTIGNVMLSSGITAKDLQSDDALFRHEDNHSKQWSSLGAVGSTLVWGMGWYRSFTAGALGPGGGGCLNPLEMGAVRWDIV
jgi:hypothetical protein